LTSVDIVDSGLIFCCQRTWNAQAAITLLWHSMTLAASCRCILWSLPTLFTHAWWCFHRRLLQVSVDAESYPFSRVHLNSCRRFSV
jgi:hypothetical protein